MSLISYLTGKKEPVLTEQGYKNRGWMLLYGVSLCMHLAFFLVIVFVQNFNVPRPVPPAIRVNLVSLAPSIGNLSNSVPSAKPVLKKENVKKSEPVKKESIALSKSDRVRIIKPDRILEVKPLKYKKFKHITRKLIKSLKSKTYRTSKVIESARQNIARGIEKKEKKTLDKVFARLKEKVSKEGNSKSGVSGQALSGSKLENGDVKAIDLYNMELMYRIQQNWAFNDILAGSDKHLEVRVIIKILKDGKIKDAWVETRSGNGYLDESALRAIKKSDPLPELPRGYSSYDIGLIFTPSGLK